MKITSNFMDEVYTFFRIAALFVGLAFVLSLSIFFIQPMMFKESPGCLYTSELEFSRHASVRQKEFCERSGRIITSTSIYISAVVTYLITIKKKKSPLIKKRHAIVR
ncbi:hypothetical protein KA078_02685 [Candidatus Woesebacteria bacterium]|nr:hypothetical protein [Candidatus Woesebacteria bacterium]